MNVMPTKYEIKVRSAQPWSLAFI